MTTSINVNIPAGFRQQVHEALKAWNASSRAGNDLGALRLVQTELAGGAGSVRQATNRVLMQALDTLATTHPRDAALLSMRFVDALPTYVVANRMHAAEASIYRWQSQAIDQLTDLLWDLERGSIERQVAVLESRLEPASYQHLFGIESHRSMLLDVMLSHEPPWLVTIEGIGGIGKTSLADAVFRAAIRLRPNHNVAWVSARQQSFDLTGRIRNLDKPILSVDTLLEALTVQLLPQSPGFTTTDAAISALRAYLVEQPALVAIDNLETAVDVDSLLPVLHRLSNPTKFLLTTRHGLYGETGVFHLRLPELGEADAHSLLRLEAGQRNLKDLSTASEIDLHTIYQTVGGNPLALRLVVGLALCVYNG